MEHINALTTQLAQQFAAACYEQNTIDELASAIAQHELGNSDEQTQEDWGMTPEQYLMGMHAALSEQLADIADVEESFEHESGSATFVIGNCMAQGSSRLFCIQRGNDGRFSVCKSHEAWGNNQDLQADMFEALKSDDAEWLAEYVGIK